MTPVRFPKTPLALLVAALSALAPVAGAVEQPRFYLSTERVFTPQDPVVQVRLEAREIEYLDLRLYRIEDPEAFFASQPDLHRIETQNGPKRVSSLDVAHELWRLHQANLLSLSRERLSEPVRAAGRQAFPERVSALRQAAQTEAPPSTAVPLLAGLPVVDIWREDLGEEEGEWQYRDVALAARAPGVYLVEGVYGEEVGYTVVIVSRLVLLVRQSASQLLVWAVDPDLGTPVVGAEIAVRDQNGELARGRTGDDGLFEKDIPLRNELTLVGRRGQDFALSDPVYHPANLFGRKVYLTTERPVYRPGQEVFYKGVLREVRNERYELDEVRQAAVRLIDPNGQQLFTQEVAISESGSFDGKFALFESAALGTYRLVATVDGSDYGAELKVKAYRKPEYKVMVESPRRAYVGGEKVKLTVSAAYYFGPPVRDARVKVSVYRTRFQVPWWLDAEYSWYYSESEVQNTARETLLEKEGRLDAAGRFELEFDTQADSLDYTYGVEAAVIDAADQAIVGSGSIQVTRARFRLVVEPDYLLNSPGQEARVRLQASDFDRKPVAVQARARVLARRAEGGQLEILQREVTIGADGVGELRFTPEVGGAYTVEVEAQDERGNRVVGRERLFVTSAGGDIPYAPDELEIIPDRRVLKVGDRARFLLLVPHADARLLVTVEGGRIYRRVVLPARGTSAVFELPIEEAQTPNFFLRAATVFDRAQLERRIDVVVPPRDRLLGVTVQPDRAEARPGERVGFTVAVRDAAGRAVAGAEVALALVDEAIYGLSPEIAVPIERFFYHRKRNDVRATCSLDFRFYGYGQASKDKMAALELRAPVVPGSFKALASGEVRKRFRDTLAWMPALVTGPDGTARVEVELPDNLTAWRGMARVITADTRVGQGTGRLRVSKPVSLRLASPAYYVEGDHGQILLLAHNTTAQAQTLKLALETLNGSLELEGAPQSVEVAPGALGAATFKVRAVVPGEAVLRARAEGQAGLGDALEQRLAVRRWGQQQLLLAGGVLDDAQPEADVPFAVPESAAPDSARLTVSLSTGVAPALLSALEYLAGYPYGCTEQTMSRFLPDLVVARALGELGLRSPALEEKLPEFIGAGLARLRALQHEDGGWGWWPEDETDPQMTAYVVHGLALARRLSWPVDEGVLSRGANRLKDLAGDGRLSPTARAYLLYSLALAGVKYESMLDKLAGSPDELTDYGRSLLALALFDLGRRDAAEQLVGRIEQAVHRVPASGAESGWWGAESAPGWEDDPVESTAAALRSLLLLRPDSALVPAAVRWLMGVREEGRWRSTRDTAMAVFALVDYLKRSGAGAVDARVRVRFNDTEAPTVALGAAQFLAPSVPALPAAAARLGDNRLQLVREGKGALFYEAAMSYFGREERMSARGERFRITRRLFEVRKTPTAEGWSFQTVPLLGPVAPGQEVLVVLEISAAAPVDYLLVEDPLAAGVQAVEQDAGYDLGAVRLRQPGQHREFHDQHVAFFLRHLERGKRSLAYLVRATLPGEYRIPPARVLPMYDPQFAGTSSSDRLAVED